jgi:hypothetical protein
MVQYTAQAYFALAILVSGLETDLKTCGLN